MMTGRLARWWSKSDPTLKVCPEWLPWLMALPLTRNKANARYR